MAIARFLSALPTGTVVTLGIIYLMHALIVMQPTAASEPRERFELGFLPKIEDPPIEPTPFDSVKPMPPVSPPAPRLPIDAGDSFDINLTPPAPPTPSGKPNYVGQLNTDGPLVAMVRVRPTYPPDALTRGLDGYCEVRFDVTAEGLVTNARVVESSHRSFERASLRAIERFRYKPRVVDGVPVESRGLQYRFRFTLEQ